MGLVNTCYIALSSLCDDLKSALLPSSSVAPLPLKLQIKEFFRSHSHWTIFRSLGLTPPSHGGFCTCKRNLRGFIFWRKARPIDFLFLFGPQTSYQRGPIPAKCCLSPALFFDGPVADLGPARVHFACKPGELILCFLIWAKNNVSACHSNNFFIDSQRCNIYVYKNIMCGVRVGNTFIKWPLNVWLVRRGSQSDCETGEFRFHSSFLQMGTDAPAASWWDKS